MRIVLLGPPGAGKGTQADILVKKLLVPHISTGDMFRAAISHDTELGREAKSYMDKGQLVPDEVTVGIIRDRISQSDCREGFLLDGFPRTLAQAEALAGLLEEMNISLDAVINISVPLDRLIDRLTGRRMCRKCGTIYHLLYNAPEVENICDACGGDLFQRDDDKEETVKSRLDVYSAQTAPLIDYYREAGLLHDVNGDQPINAVLAELGAALGQNWS
ncbi:MAG: adenylate kinase [Clostridia bacterium]|nr:adenylate kinase [Clostridia bacterium]